MRATTQLAHHLGLDNVGLLTTKDFKPLILSDLYDIGTNEVELPDNLQLYSVAEKLIEWWRGLLQTDVLRMPEAFKRKMEQYTSIAEGAFSHPCQKVLFTLKTTPQYPRQLQVKLWDKQDVSHALFLSLDFPKEATVEQLKNDNALWYPNWTNHLSFERITGILYNSVLVCRIGGRWSCINAEKIPDNIDQV